MSSVSGTSRRSHTKSRKGCKTCKKRHIRCDETFPQCRNCTKHQVRCDYMDATSQDDIPISAAAPGALYSPEIEVAIARWQESGVAAVGSISMDLQVSFDYSADDLRLLYHILRAGQSAESREFTIWTNTFTQGLAAARSHEFLMHAGFAFTAFSLAFESGSHEAKGLAYHYGGVALRGLQDAISNFSRENADAVLLASRLLAWQANDWRSWTSLTSGIRTVVNSMQEFRDESTIPDVIDQEDAAIPQSFPDAQRSPINEEFYGTYVTTLQSCLMAIDNLLPYFAGRTADCGFIDQLRDYVRRLLGVRPAYSPEEQFNHLYALRKWLFYVPVISLRSPNKDFLTLVVIAYFYAVALSMDSLFPNVAPVLLSSLAATPLSEIFEAFDRQTAADVGDSSLQVQASLMAFPRQAYATHRASQQERKRSIEMGMNAAGFEGFREQLAYSIEGQGLSGHRSPGFGPPPRTRDLSRTSSSGQTYLEVPILGSDPVTGAEATYQASTTLSGLNISTEPEELHYGETDLPGGGQGMSHLASPSSHHGQHYGPYHQPSPSPSSH